MEAGTCILPVINPKMNPKITQSTCAGKSNFSKSSGMPEAVNTLRKRNIPKMIDANFQGRVFFTILPNFFRPIFPKAMDKIKLMETPISVATSFTGKTKAIFIKRSAKGAMRIMPMGIRDFAENLPS